MTDIGDRPLGKLSRMSANVVVSSISKAAERLFIRLILRFDPIPESFGAQFNPAVNNEALGCG
jgi:hypothetical protein